MRRTGILFGLSFFTSAACFAAASVCDEFEGTYKAKIRLLPSSDSFQDLCVPEQENARCIINEKDADIVIASTTDDCDEEDYVCCMTLSVTYNTAFPPPFNVVSARSLCYEAKTRGPNAFLICDAEINGNLGDGTDRFRLLGGDQLTITTKSGLEPDVALANYNGKRNTP